MKNFNSFIQKASSLVLLAFCFTTSLHAQEVKSLSGANSPNDDTNPVWIGNNTLLFTRAFHPDNLGGENDPGDIWMTQKNEAGEWMMAVHRPDLSSTGYDLALGLEDVLTLLVLRQGAGLVTVHQYSKFGSDWNYLRQVTFPALNLLSGLATGRVVEGGKQILISAILEDGIGNEDIYVSEKLGPIQWSELQTLGPVINGKAQEMGPFFDPDKQELFYSSNSHPGATGKDILISKKLGDSWQSWSVPVKWEQISSRGSEASITLVDKKEVIWTSTQNSDGFADLMTFATPVPLVLPEKFVAPALPVLPKTEMKPAAGRVSNQAPVVEKAEVVSNLDTSLVITKTEVEVVEIPVQKENPIRWMVVDAKSKTPIAYELMGVQGDHLVQLVDTVFLSALKATDISAINVVSLGYFPKQIVVDLLDTKESNLVQLTKAEAGSVLLLENVNFQRGTSELENDNTKQVLKDLALFLQENQNLKIRINGHTDNVGDPGLNKQLSLERAGSVRDYLVSEGVEFERIRISGWGGTKPIASNITESGRAKNRRVELAVEN